MIVYTGGTFDVPHIGHAKFLQLCKEFFPGSRLIVSLNTDDFVERFKGKRPLFSYQERKSYLQLLGLVDEVIVNIHGEDSKPAILQVMPNVVAIGNDWLERDYCKQMQFDADWLTANNIALVFIPRPGGLSSTKVKERLKNA